MKLSTADILKYSYCPKLYEQASSLPLLSQDQSTIGPVVKYQDLLSEAFSQFILLFFRKELEEHRKPLFSYAMKLWERLYKPKDTRKYNKSVVMIKSFYDWYSRLPCEVISVNHNLTSFLYSYTLTGVIPVVLLDQKKTGAYLIFLSSTPTVDFDSLYLPLFLQEEMERTEVLGSVLLSLTTDVQLMISPIKKFDSRFFQSSLQDFLGVAQSIKEGLTYPNYAACNLCPIRMTCKARNGDE